MASLRDHHLVIVGLLKSRDGKDIFKPFSSKIEEKIDENNTDVYVKGMPFDKDFVSGTAVFNKDCSINILEEAMADLVGQGPYNIGQLGLCHYKCKYAKHDDKTYPRIDATKTIIPTIDDTVSCSVCKNFERK
jgi:hypothetical protein